MKKPLTHPLTWVYTWGMSKKQKRPQAPKSRSLVALSAIQATGAGKHKSAKAYARKPKHFKGWE